jgi:hypothetical protein
MQDGFDDKVAWINQGMAQRSPIYRILFATSLSSLFPVLEYTVDGQDAIAFAENIG